ncbi:ATP-binding cassette domain-containing protein [Microbacterium sp. LjRoot45]|uniref:ATP-binding cassette domain-containing protein n=1 Tax=Microbacterium sp. LjRoot45 TaxID=3342329 RepID=UPI003ED0D755
MTLRPGPLRAAAALAVGFIVVRVVYRVLFHGVDGDGILLLDLPAYRMPPPLDHVELLGPVTTGGLAAAALSAVPIAAVILAFGLLNALVDLPRLLARGARSGPFHGLARALAVAWATLPALVDGVRAVRFAQRLRGDRGGLRVLSPVLERTIERATALAAALELRGYAGRGLDGDCAHPVVVRDAAAGFADRTVVTVPELTLSPGELVAVAGATGAGKSTLLRTLSGLHTHVDGGWASGTIHVVGLDRRTTPPRDTSRTVGVVLQQPRESFAAGRVDEEIGLSLELRGVASVLRAARVREVAERVGIIGLLDRRVRDLSAGEATLVAIAAAIVEHPILLLVDEPLADLDHATRARIVALLGALAHDAGMCVVVAEHRIDALAGIADRLLVVEGAGVVEAAGVVEGAGVVETAPAGERQPIAGRNADRAGATPNPAVALRADAVTVRHGERVAVDAASIALHAGECVALTGPNGAGKSSLLVALATGTGGAPAPGRRVALVPDASDDLFVRDTVAAECRRADRRASATPGTTLARFARLLGRTDQSPGRATTEHTTGRVPEQAALDAWGRRHPRDLSAGERRCLAIALQTAHRPAVLLVDEPTRGLDPRARELVRRALEAQADAGTAVLVATHDAAFVAALADRVLHLRDGLLTADTQTTTHTPAPSPAAPTTTHAPAPLAATRSTRSIPTTPSAPKNPGAASRRGASWRTVALAVGQVAAIAAFAWPLAAAAVPAQAQDAVPVIALSLAPLAVVVVLAALDASVRSAHTLALLAVLAAIGAAVRIASTGVGGVEALFVLLILAGRALGPRFGLLLGAASIALSALLWGGVGPWLPFQMFACGWVAAGAGLLPRRLRGAAEIVMLCVYGILASYLFGLVMNLWFWPFAVAGDTSISYVPGGPLGENLGNFLVYTLVTSTATWDTLRAVTTVVGIALVGRAVLASLRRAKPVAAPASPTRASRVPLPAEASC